MHCLVPAAAVQVWELGNSGGTQDAKEASPLAFGVFQFRSIYNSSKTSLGVLNI